MTRTTDRQALSIDPAAILARLPAMGGLMFVGRRDGIVHERIGPVETVTARGGRATLAGPCHDSGLLTGPIDRIVYDRSTVMKDKVYPKIEFLQADGTRLAAVVGMDGADPFEAALQDVTRVDAPAPAEAEGPSGPATPLADDDPGRLPFDAAAARGCTIEIEFRGRAMRQRWQGKVEAVRAAMGHINVMTPDFHLHLKAGTVAEWRVSLAGGGPALAAFGPDGEALGLTLKSERLADLGIPAPGLTAHPAGRWIAPAAAAPADHAVLMADLARRQVVLLGETHDRADNHRWQLHVAAGLLAHRPDIAIGFEMFPRRVQPALDAWVAGDLAEETFLARAEWEEVWGFPPSLYLPLFRFCREFRLPMLALNCRRALVTEVGKQGWDAIPEADRDGVTPAREATPAYRQYLFDIAGGGPRGGAAAPRLDGPMDPGFDRFVRAQQCWDRAFACNIARALARPEPPLVIGVIGRGHLEYGHGTAYQLRDLGVGPIATLLPTYAAEFSQETFAGIADAVFRIPRAPAGAAPV